MAVKVKQHKGKWWVFIDHKGKRKAKCVGSKQAAETAAKKIEAKLTLGDFTLLDEKPQRPFDAYFRQWLETYVKLHCKPSTVDRYQQSFRLFLLPALGSKDITGITRDDVKRLVYDMHTRGKHRNTIKATLTPLRELFNHAVDDGHIVANPALRILRYSRAEAGEAHYVAHFLTREEVGQLLSTCKEHFPAAYPFISLLVKTGLRWGEAIALQWDDVDWQNRCVVVKRTLREGRIGTPKNGKVRRVDLSLQLVDLLKALHLERKKETLRKGWGDVPLWVFITRDGTPLDHRHFYSRVWQPLLKKAELPTIRVHDLRHTFASLLIQNGESLAYVKDQMGHHSIKLTVDTYGHLVPGGNKAAVDRLDTLETATIRNPDATTPENAVLSLPKRA